MNLYHNFWINNDNWGNYTCSLSKEMKMMEEENNRTTNKLTGHISSISFSISWMEKTNASPWSNETKSKCSLLWFLAFSASLYHQLMCSIICWIFALVRSLSNLEDSSSSYQYLLKSTLVVARWGLDSSLNISNNSLSLNDPRT